MRLLEPLVRASLQPLVASRATANVSRKNGSLVSCVLFDVQDGVASITFARPASSNAVDLQTAHEFAEAVALAAKSDARVALITSQGKRFCAGGDLRSLGAHEERAHSIRLLADAFDDGLQRLAALEMPVVSSVQGAVAGAGVAVVLASDLVVAVESARFSMAYGGVGLTPDCGVSYLLPRAVGQQRALDFALTGRVLSAHEAASWGLVTTVVADADLLGTTKELCTRLAGGPAFALSHAKRLIRESWNVTRAESGADESATIELAIQTEDATRLIDRFLG